MLEGEIELDETQLFKPKKTSVIHRPYSSKDVWIFGMIERRTNHFIIIPLNSKTEKELHSYILRFGSTLYSDCFSSYVNNHTFPKQSKLEEYGYLHHFINHKERFRSSIFQDIHTNRIKNLWGRLKKCLRKMKMTSHYEYAIARFFLSKLNSK